MDLYPFYNILNIGGRMEKEVLGQVFRDLRETKNMSLAQAAGDGKSAQQYVMSRQQLSRFELGESDLGLTKIFALLDNIGVTFEEYLYQLRGYHQSVVWDLFYKLDVMHEKRRFKEMLELGQQLEKTYQATGKRSNYWRWLEVRAVLGSVYASVAVTDEEISKVGDYLFSVLEWTEEEFFLFFYFAAFLPSELVDELFQNLIAQEDFYQDIQQNKKAVIIVAKGLMMRWLDEKDKVRAKVYLPIYRKLIDGATVDVHERKEFLFVEGAYYFLMGQPKEGEKCLRDLAQVYELLDYPKQAESILRELKNFQE